MTAYRDPPIHCLPKKRKPVSWWRRFKAQRKARRWHAALLETSLDCRIDRQLKRIEEAVVAIGRNFGEARRKIDRPGKKVACNHPDPPCGCSACARYYRN